MSGIIRALPLRRTAGRATAGDHEIVDLASFGSGDPIEMATPASGPTAVRTRYLADVVVPADGSGAVLAPGVVEVEGTRIVHVGRTPTAVVAEEVRLHGLVMPGIVNAHSHWGATVLRGAPRRRGEDDVEGFVSGIEARLSPEDVYWSVLAAAGESLRSGVTATCDMYVHEESTAEAVIAAGPRALLTPLVQRMPSEDGTWTGWTQRLEEVAAFHHRYHGREHRIDVGIGPKSFRAVPIEVMTVIAALAADLDAAVHLHLAATREEVEEVRAATGRGLATLLEDIGLFDVQVLLAHGTWLSEADISRFGDHTVGVAHLPACDVRRAAGIAPVAAMLSAGMHVGVGADWSGLHGDPDPWNALRLAAALTRIGGGDAVAPSQVIELATRHAAVALGKDDLGTLRPGAAADFVLVDLEDPVFAAHMDASAILDALVWAGQSRMVSDVWVGGRRVVERRRVVTFDEREARAQMATRARRILAGS